jgi:lactate permease
MMAVFWALLPLLLLIYWMTKSPGMPSNRALPLAALLQYGVLLVVFRFSLREVHAAVIEGLLTALTPILIVWGAILLFRTMETSGAMNQIRAWLNGVTRNPVAQLMIVGWSFSFLVEGVSGFGTPAALAAPLLVGLGFAPLPVVVLCLMMNSIPVSFGAVGMPTWFGFGGLGLSAEEMREVGLKTALLHAAAALMIPLLALRVLLPWREIVANLRFVLLVLTATLLAYVGVAAVSVEFPSIAGGLTALVVSITLSRGGVGLSRAKAEEVETVVRPTVGALVKASFPLWGTVLVLLITRLEPLGLRAWLVSTVEWVSVSLGGWGELRLSPSWVIQWRNILGEANQWSHALFYVPSLVPFALISSLTFLGYRTSFQQVGAVWRTSTQQVLKPVGAFLGALVLVKLLAAGGDRSCTQLLGRQLAEVAGGGWQFVAVYLGALGSFFSGSCTVSNLTFGGIQDSTALTLGLSRSTILSLQSVGAAMGNMVCIHNVVAACSILGIQNQEGSILRQTFGPMLLYGVVVSLVALFL